MSEPVKPETKTRIVDENLSGKRRRPTSQPPTRSAEGAAVPTPADMRTPLEPSTPQPRPQSTPPMPPTVPPMKAPPTVQPMQAPPTPQSAPAREVSAPAPRYVGPLDPVMPAPKESSTSGPRPRPAANLDPEMPAPALAAEVSESRPKRKARKGLSPMVGAVGAALFVVVIIVASLIPRGVVRSAGPLAPSVPGMVALWGGPADAPQVRAYVTRVAATVTSKSVAVPTVNVIVAQEASAHAVALPGREILISAGLLRRLVSEAQLAAVVAHLLAHIESGDIDKAFLEGKDPDVRARARVAATTPSSAEAERRATERTKELLEAAGYTVTAFADVHAALSARSGRMTAFVQQHPVPTDALAALRSAPSGGRTGDSDYARHVLDGLGRAAAPSLEKSPNPPLPPKPPPTPKPDTSRPVEGGRKANTPASPPKKPGATSEPPMPPL